MEMSMYQDNETGKTQQMKKTMQLDFASKGNKGHKFQNMLNSPDLNMLKLSSPELEKMLITQNGTVGTTPTPTQFVYPKYVTDEQEAYARGFVEALAELHSGPNMPATSGNSNNQPGPSNNMTQPGNRVAGTSTYSTLMPMSTQSSYSTACNVPPASSYTMMNPSISRRHPPFAPSGLLSGNSSMAPHQAPPQMPPTVPASTAYGTIQVKSEPSTSSYSDHQVPHSPSGTSSRMTDSPSLSDNGYDHVENINRLDSIPVDLEEQEKIKLERKRARNRIAARKCRTRKLERIGRLEEKVADLKGRNNELAQTAASLHDQVTQLKQQIMEHMKSGCHIMMPEMGQMVGMM